MRWIHLVVIILSLHCVLTQKEDNEVSDPPPNGNLDSNLREALLKALTELENEEKGKSQFYLDDDSRERIVEKASAASVSIFSNGETVTISPSSSTTTSTTPETVKVLFQKSQFIQQPTIITKEKEDESENILTSATNNFANQPFGKIAQTEKQEKKVNQNSILTKDKSVDKQQKEITTSAPIVSTEENEAKVEDVQFFSAPLVAAFTVHQDDFGLPKKVEPIFKSHISTKSQEDIIFENEQQIKLAKHQERIRLEEIKRLQEQLRLHQKQKDLEEEIYRLNQSLKQQQQFFLRQQEEFRSNNNAQQFVPVNNPNFSSEKNVLNQNQQLPIINQQQVFKPLVQSSVQPALPINNPNFSTGNLNQNQKFTSINQQQSLSQPANIQSILTQSQLPLIKQEQPFKPSVSVQPSVEFDSLLEAGKLPLNAQFLPVKGPVDFRSNFAVNSFNRHTSTDNFFNENNSNLRNTLSAQSNSANNNFNQQQIDNNRILRQNTGVGNFGINNNILPIQNFDSSVTNNRIFRSNLESTLTSHQFLQPSLSQTVQSNRFFRSNLEGSLSSPNNVFNPQVNNNYQLTNLLHNSGAFQGKTPEDLSIITKVLSLNHQIGNGISLRPELRQQIVRNF